MALRVVVARALPVIALLAWASVPAAHGEPGGVRTATTRSAPDEEAASKEPRLYPIYTPAPAVLSAAWFASVTPASGLSALSCLAALLSCAFSITLWRRVDSGQEAAKASMYAAGKLFDVSARRFAHSQDEAGSAVEAAASAAGQAGQAAARLAAAVRDTEARLSASLGEGETRLHAAAGLLARYDSASAGLPALVAEALDRISAGAVPAIEDATATLRGCAETISARLMSALRTLPDLMADAAAAADARGASALQDAGRQLQNRADAISAAAEALPAAGEAFDAAAASLAEAQARHAAMIARVEALAGVLPSIATSLASTAAGQRQLLAHGRLGVDTGIQELRHAASRMSASVDEAAVLLRRSGEVAPVASPRHAAAPVAAMHPALRPHDFNATGRVDTPVRRQASEDAVQDG